MEHRDELHERFTVTARVGRVHNERIYIRVGSVIYDVPPDELKAAVDAAVAALPPKDATKTFPAPNLVRAKVIAEVKRRAPETLKPQN